MIKINNKLLFYLSHLLIFLVFISCDLITPPSMGGVINYVDFTDFEKIHNGQEGLIDYGGILIGTNSVHPLKIQNSGEGNLVIFNISIDGTGFSFADDKAPDFPLIIPEGKTINDIFIEFDPQTGGEFSGTLFIEMENETDYFDLVGLGLWQLTLTGVANCTITSPAVVTVGNSIDVTSPTGVFNLISVIDPFYDLDEWDILGSPGINEEFENEYAKETTITLTSHTTIFPVIVTPFTFVLNNTQSIQTAIDACAANPDANPTGVVVRSDNYTENLIIKPGVSLYGGYESGAGTNRDYINRSSYQTIINGTITATDSAITNTNLIEGFIINGSVSFSTGADAGIQHNTITATGASPAVTINNTTSVVQNNIITGGTSSGESVAILSTGSTAPRILNNNIAGGTTSADYSESYGIKVSEASEPIIYKNTISGGTAAGTGSESFGIFNDFECEPLIRGNTIDGGTAAGTSGQSYGIFMINNGKVYADYNSINGGAGKTSYGLYVAYGGNLYLDYNNIFTSNSSSNRNGVYIGTQGRVRRLLNNGMYDCPDSLLHTSIPSEDKTDIDDVNDHFHTDTNTDTAISFTIPDEPAHE